MKKKILKIYLIVQILKEMKLTLELILNKKNVDSGSTFKTFVDSLHKVKNNANIQLY
jgi:hypothetical protein